MIEKVSKNDILGFDFTGFENMKKFYDDNLQSLLIYLNKNKMLLNLINKNILKNIEFKFSNQLHSDIECYKRTLEDLGKYLLFKIYPIDTFCGNIKKAICIILEISIKVKNKICSLTEKQLKENKLKEILNKKNSNNTGHDKIYDKINNNIHQPNLENKKSNLNIQLDCIESKKVYSNFEDANKDNNKSNPNINISLKSESLSEIIKINKIDITENKNNSSNFSHPNKQPKKVESEERYDLNSKKENQEKLYNKHSNLNEVIATDKNKENYNIASNLKSTQKINIDNKSNAKGNVLNQSMIKKYKI